MKPLLSVLKAAFRSSSRKSPARQAKKKLRRYFQLEPLEDRRVFDAAFGSVIGIGNGESASLAHDVAVDSAGNRYVSGYFTGAVDFDPANVHAGDVDILMAAGARDAYLAKYAPDDSLLWVRQMGASISDPNAATAKGYAAEVELDTSGNPYLAGTIEGTIYFGGTSLSSVNGTDSFVAKLSAVGDFIWAKSWDNLSTDNVASLDVDAAGNALLLANGSGSTTTVNIRKYDANSSFLWSKSIVVNGPYIQGGIATDSNKSIYVTGSFTGTVDFNPGSGVNNVSAGNSPYSAFTLKLDSQGNFGWVSPFLKGYSWNEDVEVDSAGNVIVGGLYRNTTSWGSVDFNPGNGVTNLSNSAGGAFVAKLNKNGGLVWVDGLNVPTDSATVRRLALDSNGAIYATGSFQGQIDLNPGSGVATAVSAGGLDIFVLKVNSSGTYQWSESFGGIGNDYAYGIAVDSANNVHLAGYFQYAVDFDAGAGDATLTTNASKGFLKRLRQI